MAFLDLSQSLRTEYKQGFPGDTGWIGPSVVTGVLPLTGWVKAQFGISTAQRQPAASPQRANPTFPVSFFPSETEVSSLPLSFSAQAVWLPAGSFGRQDMRPAQGTLGLRGKRFCLVQTCFLNFTVGSVSPQRRRRKTEASLPCIYFCSTRPTKALFPHVPLVQTVCLLCIRGMFKT